MKYLDERYAKVYTQKGIDICSLKSACPAEGDSFGYAIDHSYFKGQEYNHPSDAVKAINKAIKDKKI